MTVRRSRPDPGSPPGRGSRPGPGRPDATRASRAVARLSALRRAVPAGRLPVTRVLIAATPAWGRAVPGGWALLIGRWRVTLIRIAALVGVTLARRVSGRALRRIAAGVRWGILAAGLLGMLVVLLTAIPLVVILVGGPPLSLAAAVGRIVAHRYS